MFHLTFRVHFKESYFQSKQEREIEAELPITDFR